MVGVMLEDRLDEGGSKLGSNTQSPPPAADARMQEEVSAQRQHTGRETVLYQAKTPAEEVPAAGLASERCTRDFVSRCNLLLHSGTKRQPAGHQVAIATTYEQKRPKQALLDWRHRYGDSVPGSGSDVTPNVGASDKKSELQMKLRQDYRRYNTADGGVHIVTQKETKAVETATIRERDANRIRNMQHCCIFNDTEEQSSRRQEQREQEQPQPQQQERDDNNLDPRTFTLDTEVTSRSRSQMNEQSLSDPDSSPASLGAPETEVTIIGGLRDVNSRDPEWEIVSFRMSGIRPSFTEQDFEGLARKARMQIVSVNLDRNIITHLCNGTGSMRCRHTGGERGLMYFSRLMAKNGIRLYITDIISKSDVVRRGHSHLMQHHND